MCITCGFTEIHPPADAAIFQLGRPVEGLHARRVMAPVVFRPLLLDSDGHLVSRTFALQAANANDHLSLLFESARQLLLRRDIGRLANGGAVLGWTPDSAEDIAGIERQLAERLIDFLSLSTYGVAPAGQARQLLERVSTVASVAAVAPRASSADASVYASAYTGAAAAAADDTDADAAEAEAEAEAEAAEAGDEAEDEAGDVAGAPRPAQPPAVRGEWKKGAPAFAAPATAAAAGRPRSPVSKTVSKTGDRPKSPVSKPVVEAGQPARRRRPRGGRKERERRERLERRALEEQAGRAGSQR